MLLLFFLLDYLFKAIYCYYYYFLAWRPDCSPPILFEIRGRKLGGETGLLSRSIVMVISDHGIAYGRGH